VLELLTLLWLQYWVYKRVSRAHVHAVAAAVGVGVGVGVAVAPALQVTALSGYLYKFSKDERRVKLQEALAGFSPPR
jgi:hypothetical protein